MLPWRKVVRVLKLAWPYWSCARLSFDSSSCVQPPASICWRPWVQKMWSSKVKRLRVVALLEPTLAPAVVMVDAPLEAVEPEMTTAPVGLPGRKVGRSGLYRRGNRAEEVEVRPRDPEAGGVQQLRREDMLLLQAGHLFAQALVDQGQWVLRGGVRGGIIDGVDGEEQIVGSEVGVEAGGSEVFMDVLRRAREGLADAGGQAGGGKQFGAVLHGPQVQQTGDARSERNRRQRAGGGQGTSRRCAHCCREPASHR